MQTRRRPVYHEPREAVAVATVVVVVVVVEVVVLVPELAAASAALSSVLADFHRRNRESSATLVLGLPASL